MARRMTVIFDDEELYTALKVEAARRHCPAKQIVAEAIREWFVEFQEDEEDRRIAEERLESYRREGGVPHDEVMEKLGLTRVRKS
ncbi:MAG: hypothetical protein HYY03_05660 [Chloroflexi bacterium]|nr:hypothetical protein [Chloroflexota bacterium]